MSAVANSCYSCFRFTQTISRNCSCMKLYHYCLSDCEVSAVCRYAVTWCGKTVSTLIGEVLTQGRAFRRTALSGSFPCALKDVEIYTKVWNTPLRGDMSVTAAGRWIHCSHNKACHLDIGATRGCLLNRCFNVLMNIELKLAKLLRRKCFFRYGSQSFRRYLLFSCLDLISTRICESLRRCMIASPFHLCFTWTGIAT